ncbi:MAG: hypothetical protein LBT46_02310 [Planctomycetaceae bacterium]|jgi:hypothetical protein|nr:hypothetical protein [Planctomycetaceae bacterium]
MALNTVAFALDIPPIPLCPAFNAIGNSVKIVLSNKYYEKFSDFADACKGFFRCRKKYAE